MSNAKTTTARQTKSLPWRALGALLIAAGLLIPGTIARADHETRDGLYSETQYLGVQFLYDVQWEAPWEADHDEVESVEDEYDRIVVLGPDGSLEVLLTFEEHPEAEIEGLIETRAEQVDDLEVMGRDEAVDGFDFPVFTATLAYQAPGPDGDEVRLIEYVEVGHAYTNGGGNGTLTLSLVAPADELEDVYQEVQDLFVTYSGMLDTTFFAGQPTLESGDDRDRGDDDSDERDSDEDEEDEDEEDERRSDEDDDRAAEEDEEDERAAGSGLDGDAYESPTWGYSVEWDDDVWTTVEVSTEDDIDFLTLRSRSSTLFLLASDAYPEGPESCVEAWADYLSGEAGVDDWEPLEDEDGEPVAGEDDDRAWAAFTLTFTSEAGDEYENVNYLECRSLPGSDATLAIIHMTSQDGYEDEADAVEEVLETIEPAESDDDRDANRAADSASIIRNLPSRQPIRSMLV